jgi:serine/threonine-protein kinase
MATVYLARDLKHDRAVAVKVLHSQLAATLGPGRFLREIRTTARLQHPHILTVLDSGEAAGQLWYTMPYVRGESLRECIRREVQLPVEHAVDLAGQVALALDYAHREGVVHRDIKPENILLSDGQALVGDFGVAKALEAGGEQLTSTGMALGTPQYMSPEQASGGSVDARTDVYALGCVLYEMLTGEAPFTGGTPQAILAKRVLEPVPHARTLRDSVPDSLEQAIIKALARSPADRFQSAGDFARALALSTRPAAAPSHAPVPTAPPGIRLTRRRAIAGAVLASLGLGAAAAGYTLFRIDGRESKESLLAAGVFHKRERLLLAEFGTRQVDSTLGGVLTEALRIDLTQSPAVTLVSPVQVAEVLGRMQRSATSRLDPALAREVALREGIKAVITGEVARAGSQYLLSAQVISAKDGDVLTADRTTATDSTTLIAAVDRLSKNLRTKIGESLRSINREPPLERVTTASLSALRQYSAAVRAGDHEGDWDKALTLLGRAIALDSGFAMAYRTLGMYAANLGKPDRVAEGYDAAMQRLDRLTERERNFTLGDHHLIVEPDLHKAAAAYEAILEDHPDEREALNNLGNVYAGLGQFTRAESVYRRAIAVDSSYVSAYNNLILVQIALKAWQRAQATFESATRQLPELAWVIEMGIKLAEQSGDYRLARARAQELLQRFGGDPYWRAEANWHLGSLEALAGRLRNAERYLRTAMTARLEALSAASHIPGAGTPRYFDDVILLASLAALGGDPDRGRLELERGLDRYPLDSVGPMARPYLRLASALADAGRVDRARALVAEYERVFDRRWYHGDRSELDLSLGHIALAERRWLEAIARFQAATREVRSLPSFGLMELARAYDLAGQPDSAMALYQRYLDTPDVLRSGSGTDAVELARTYRRLGQLFEGRGDKVKAGMYYTRFAELWKDCDPELRWQVTEAVESARGDD